MKLNFKHFDATKVLLIDRDCMIEGITILYEYIDELKNIRNNKSISNDTIKSLENQIKIIEASCEFIERGLAVVLAAYVNKDKKRTGQQQ